MSSPGPLGPLSERSIPTTPHRNRYSVSTWVNIWAPYHDTTLFQKEMTYPKGRDPHNLAAYSCFDHFRGVRSWQSLVHKATLCATKPCFGSTDDQSNDHRDKWSNKWSYHKWSNNDHFTATLSMSHHQIGNISLTTINYITFELVRLREGC